MKKYFSLLFFITALVHAENWPQLRGPNGAGISSEKGIPIKWTAKDYAWGVKLPGIGHSSPIVWEDRVIVTSAVNKGEKRFIQCFEAATGNRPLFTHSVGGSCNRYFRSEQG